MLTIKLCHLCHKQLAVGLCEGCDRCFCRECMKEHIQKFSWELDLITAKLDQLQDQQMIWRHHDYRGLDRRSVEEWQSSVHHLAAASGDVRGALHRIHKTESCNEVDLRRAMEQLHRWQSDVKHLHDQMGHGSLFGVPFVDLSDINGYKRVEWSRDAPKWRRAMLGMCLEGFCNNERCVAYGQRVIIGIGMRKFDLLADPNPSTTFCPMCKQYVEPTTCAFNNCMWCWEGIKQVPGEPPMKLSGDWKRVDDAYHYFDQTIKGTPTTSGTCIWRALQIEAKGRS